MTKPKSDYTIQTVRNALHLLEAFDDQAELGVSELARRLELHKNNVFRLLATLESGGYVEQCSSSDRYRLGVRCLSLGRSFARSHSLSARARPVLEELVAKLGETAHLGVLEDFAVVHLDGLVPDHLLVTPSRVGKRLPAHCTALGKVLLGCADSATRESFLSSVVSVGGLEIRTPATFADSHKLFDELRAVGGQGFSVDLGECEHGLHCAAAPVFGEEGRVVASLSLSGPSIRLTEDAIHREAIPALSSAAARLSRSLGHSA